MSAHAHALRSLSFVLVLLLTGCQNQLTPELNQCAQQNYQCEQTCTMQSAEATLTRQLCTQQCVDDYNACKVQAESLSTSR
jgi:hypothetical protein